MTSRITTENGPRDRTRSQAARRATIDRKRARALKLTIRGDHD